MASIRKRPGGSWRARYRDDAGREHARHFERKFDAARWIDEVTASIVTGAYIDPKAGRVTFGEFATSWAAAQVWRPATARRVRLDLRNHLMPAFGPRPLSAIRPTEVQSFVKALETKLAPSSTRMVYTTLRSVFRAAVLDRVITSSPCVRIALPTAEPTSLVVPDAATLRAIADALPADVRAVVFVAAGLGLRPGEVFGLEVADVDFLRRRVSVRRQLDHRRRLGPLKSTSAYRTIPLPQTVADVLAAHLARAGHAEGLVFRGPGGTPVGRDTFQRAWGKALALAGADGLRLHDLRHTYASALIAAGESVKVIQLRLGHASAMITLDVYGHLWPDSDDRTRVAVDAFLAAPADCVRTEGRKGAGQRPVR